VITFYLLINHFQLLL